MKIILKYTVCLYVVLLSTSCSMYKNKFNSNAKVYSISTENEFELIEKNDLYRETYNKTSAPSLTLKNPPKNIVPTPENPSKNVNAPTVSASNKLSSKNQERIIEINQNLAFYCMKHRNDPVYKSEDGCLKFTEKVLNRCQNEHQVVSAAMLSCIKTRLKNRH